MPKVNELTQRELDILANADRFSAVSFRDRSEHPTMAAAQRAAEEASAKTHRGAVVYAIGEVCGTEASAAVAFYKPGKGWEMAA